MSDIANTARLQAETAKLNAEAAKLEAESRKLLAEREKFYIEALKMERERRFLPATQIFAGIGVMLAAAAIAFRLLWF